LVHAAGRTGETFKDVSNVSSEVTWLRYSPFPIPLITRPIMSCGKVVAENWRIAPMVERAAPVRRVFLRPNLSPKRAADKQPARLPSYVLVSCWKSKQGYALKAYRKTACCNPLDIRVLGLREELNEMRADQDATNDSLIVAIPSLSSRIGSGESYLQSRTSKSIFDRHVGRV
jgi:hypothetical protein